MNDDFFKQLGLIKEEDQSQDPLAFLPPAKTDQEKYEDIYRSVDMQYSPSLYDPASGSTTLGQVHPARKGMIEDQALNRFDEEKDRAAREWAAWNEKQNMKQAESDKRNSKFSMRGLMPEANASEMPETPKHEPWAAESLPVRNGFEVPEQKLDMPAATVKGSGPSAPSFAPAEDPVGTLVNKFSPEAMDLMMKDAIEQRNQQQFAANLGIAGKQFAEAMSKGAYKADTTVEQNMMKQSGQGVQDIKDDVAHKQNMLKLQRDQDGADPASAKSQAYRQILAKMGMNQLAARKDLGADDIEKMMPQLANIYNQEQAREARRELAMLMAKEKKEAKQEELNNAERKFARDLRKETSQGKMGELFMNMKSAERAEEIIDQFAKNPTGYSDYGTLMLGLKSLQGDQSVVREAEIRLGMSAGSLMDTITNLVQRPATGKSLTDKQRKAIVSAVKVLGEKSRNQYLDSISGIVAQAEDEGVNLSRVLDNKTFAAYQKRRGVAPAASEDSSQFEQDVLDYAKKYNITPAQAQQLKMSRTGGKK